MSAVAAPVWAVMVKGDGVSKHRHADAFETTCTSSWDGWHCTRPAGHRGLHEAGTDLAAIGTRIVAIWGVAA